MSKKFENAFVELNTQQTSSKIESYMEIESHEEVAEKADKKFIKGLGNQYRITDDPEKIKIKFHDQVARIILPAGAVLVISGAFDKPSVEYGEIQESIKSLTLTDLNQILFSCEKEEQSNNPGNGCYNVPYHGPLFRFKYLSSPSMLVSFNQNCILVAID